MSIEAYFKDTVVLERFDQSATDRSGAPAGVWTTILATLVCRIVQISGTEVTRFSRTVAAHAARFYCAAGVDVRPTDRLNLGGRLFEVVSMRDVRGRFIAGDLRELV